MRLPVVVMLLVVGTRLSAQDKYAVVVGVETYDTGTFDALEYATEDARDLGDSLKELGFKTTVMTSNASSSTLRPSTPTKILKAMRTVASSCGPGDTLVISLSGHGVQFSEEPLLDTGVRETYFCPQDASLSDRDSLLKISTVIDYISRSAANRKLLLVDACRENVLSDKGKRKSARRIELGSVHENRQSVPEGMAVLFSCQSTQFSWEHEGLGHSVFTNFVINYLSGKADAWFYERGKANLDGLVYYVRKRTNDYVFGNSLSPDGQLPVLRGNTANWSLGSIERSTSSEFTNSLGMKFKLIPAGQFTMGNEADMQDLLESYPGSLPAWFADAQHRHQVKLTKPFYLATHEVTVRQFRNFVEERGYRTEAETDGKGGYGIDRSTGQLKVDPKFNWRNPGFTQSDAHPVVNVTWNDVQAFLDWLSKQDGRRYTLPTEAQWEYACRAESQTAFSFGNESRELQAGGNVAYGQSNLQIGDNNPNEGEDGHLFTSPVGRFKPNRFGMYDMHGNVWEWCSDWYDPKYYARSPVNDPAGPSQGTFRVVRGGSWHHFAGVNRSAARSNSVPFFRSNYLGFRVAASLE